MPVTPVIPDRDEMYCATCERTYPAGERCPKDGGRLVRIHRPDPLIGRELDGRYTIVDRLGQGGMGAIYRAVQRSFGRDVAIKVMNAPAGTNPELIKRFLREAKLASQLCHPNVVTVLDCGETDDGIFYIAMELVAGRTLSAILVENKRLAPERLVRIGTQICEALDGAHAMSIVHRDLKPTNVMVMTRSGRDLVKVLDFGLAKSLAPEIARTMTGLGEMIGTPAFMPPELANGQPCDSRADLYSLGCILYLCGTGELPFKSESVNELIAMHGVDKAPPMTGVPAGMARLVDRLLAKSPDERYQTAAETRDALEACLRDGATVAVPTAIGDGAAVETAPIATGGRRAPFVAGLSLAVLGALGLGATLTLDDAPDEALPASAVAIVVGVAITMIAMRGRTGASSDAAATQDDAPAQPAPVPVRAPTPSLAALTAPTPAFTPAPGRPSPTSAISDSAPTPNPGGVPKRAQSERPSAEIAVIVDIPLSNIEDAKSAAHAKLPLHVLDVSPPKLPMQMPTPVPAPRATPPRAEAAKPKVEVAKPKPAEPPKPPAQAQPQPKPAEPPKPAEQVAAAKPAPAAAKPAPAAAKAEPAAPKAIVHGPASEELAVTSVVVVTEQLADDASAPVHVEEQRSQRVVKAPLKTTIGPAITPRSPSLNTRASQPQLPALHDKPAPVAAAPAAPAAPAPAPVAERSPTPEPEEPVTSVKAPIADIDDELGINTAVIDLNARAAAASKPAMPAAAAPAAAPAPAEPATVDRDGSSPDSTPPNDDIPGEPTLVTPMDMPGMPSLSGITQPPPISRAKTPAPAPAPAPKLAPLPPGAHRLGSYVVTKPIGNTPDGPIYATRDDAHERDVQVAALPDDLDLVAFTALVKSLSKIDHAGLVRVHELVLHAGKPYLVREPLAGRALEDIVRDRGPLPWLEAVTLLDAVCSALEALHERGIVHGAVRPACIVVDGKLCKLGGVGVLPPLSKRDGLAPEGGTSRRRDVFGIGATLYHCLTGSTPTAGAPLPDTFPGKLFALATSMLAENPSDRPASIQDVRGRFKAMM
jgi:serine/threonine protein kinase|nr:protein kinase [Kofleriaceae bacterium]